MIKTTFHSHISEVFVENAALNTKYTVTSWQNHDAFSARVWRQLVIEKHVSKFACFDITVCLQNFERKPYCLVRWMEKFVKHAVNHVSDLQNASAAAAQGRRPTARRDQQFNFVLFICDWLPRDFFLWGKTLAFVCCIRKLSTWILLFCFLWLGFRIRTPLSVRLFGTRLYLKIMYFSYQYTINNENKNWG